MKRSESEWFELFDQHHQSGLSAAQFCREHQLCAKYFSLRKKQLNWPAHEVHEASQFVEVSVTEGSASCMIDFGGFKLNLTELPPVSWLADLSDRL